MGAMKAIYTDMQELQERAAEQEEEQFQQFLGQSGWMSPSEQEARRARAAEFVATLTALESDVAVRALKAVGIELPAPRLSRI